VAAGVEGLVGAMRASKRLSSRVSTPATAALAMALCGAADDALQHALLAAGWMHGSAGLLAVCAAALPYWAASMLPLLAVVAAKNRQRLSLRDWAQSYGWMGAIYLLSATIAGVLAMNARQFGPSVFVVAAAVTAATVALVHLSTRRHEADFQAQELRVADAEREAALNQQRFTAAFTHAAIGMAIVVGDGRVHKVNHVLCGLLGQAEGELLQQPFDDILHPGDAAPFQRRAEAVASGTEVMPVASIGITFSDLGYRSADEVLRDADLAMYEAKADGSRRVALFNQGMHDRVAEKLRLEGDLRRAIGEGQLTLVYQPLFRLAPHELIGFEALARWTHPERGVISPAVFITLAEESGHIEALTGWVMDQACGQLVAWQAAHPGLATLGMHVNISGRDLTSATLVPHVRDALQRHALAPRQLTLEITETTLMGRLKDVLDTVHALPEAGVNFSIDDFGTGYSSLTYPSTLAIDSLKIDRSFVAGMTDKLQNVEIVRAVLTLGRSLGQTIIAEGIETAAQLAMLEELGVDVGQGYLLARPLRAEQVPALLGAPVAAPACEQSQ
jgi:EAL domain-containing protein (putative c-di-GMP-specific phosphodiesterase class I)/PAS domain-containing protein